MTKMKTNASPILLATALLAVNHPVGCMGFPGESDPNFQGGGGPPEGVVVPGGGPPPGVVVSGGPPPEGGFVPPSASELAYMSETIEAEYDRCNAEIVDVHLHTAFWFDSAAPLLAEMERSYVSKGLMLAVYGPVADPFGGDPNEQVEAIVQESEGHIFGLASLNTTVPNWEQNGPVELERLSTFLARPNFLGTKLAPPHTCMALDSDVMRDVVHTISISPSPLAFIHMGTTPFCGPFGAAILGRPGCCGPEFVDPSYMEDLIQEYTNTTFVMVHAGADFLPPTDEYYYHGDNVDQSLRLAKTYDNVFLELSAFLRQDANHTDIYPGGTAILEQIANAGGLANKTFYGSDVNQSPGSMAPYLSGTIEKLIAAGFTEEERCLILGQNAVKIFRLDAAASTDAIQDATLQDDTATTTSSSSSSSSSETDTETETTTTSSTSSNGEDKPAATDTSSIDDISMEEEEEPSSSAPPSGTSFSTVATCVFAAMSMASSITTMVM